MNMVNELNFLVDMFSRSVAVTSKSNTGSSQLWLFKTGKQVLFVLTERNWFILQLGLFLHCTTFCFKFWVICSHDVFFSHLKIIILWMLQCCCNGWGERCFLCCKERGCCWHLQVFQWHPIVICVFCMTSPTLLCSFMLQSFCLCRFLHLASGCSLMLHF